jgi:hypothetical protein
MTTLRQRAEEYLEMRRSLGYKLLRQGQICVCPQPPRQCPVPRRAG